MSLEEAKDQIRILEDYEDDLISAKITAARQWAEAYLGKAIANQTLAASTAEFSEVIDLPMSNLIDVDTVEYLDTEANTETLPSTVYGLNKFSSPGSIYLRSGQSWPSVYSDPLAVTITYQVGWPSVPEAIKEAIRLMVGTLEENRSDNVVGLTAQELPMSAKALLWPYRTIGI